MIFKSFEIKKINFNKYNIILLYGKNEGLQNEIIEKNFTESYKGNISKYDENEFINNYQTIATEVMTNSLFEDEKIIVISRVSDKIINLIKEISEKNIKDIKIILKSGILEKKSKLRNLFEKSKKLAVIPFYEDDDKALTSIVYDFLKKNNIKISRESINLLIGRASGNRENLKTELNKILNYSYTNKEISIEAVKKLSNLAENYGVNELADSYLAKNKKNIIKILNENNYSDEDCILILRTILSKSKRLIEIFENLKINENLDEVISKIRPPIFWKDKEIVKKQAFSWKIDDLKDKLCQINEVETLVKTNNRNSLNIVSDFIINY